MTNPQPNPTQPLTNSPLKKFLRKKWLVLIILILMVIITYIILPKFSHVITGKVDDWQFQTTPDSGGYGILGPLSNLTFTSIIYLLIFLPIFCLIPLSMVGMAWRFWGFIIRRFRPASTFGQNKLSRHSVIGFSLSLLLGVGIILLTNKYPDIFSHSVEVAIYLAGILIVLIYPLAILYILISFLFWLIKKIKHLNNFSFKRRLAYSLITLNVFIIPYAVYKIYTLFLGVDVLNLSFPSYESRSAIPAPGALPPAGGGGVTNIGSIQMAPPSASISHLNPLSITPESGFKSSNSDNIGFSAGGAKDINNFRENIKNNYLPLATDVTYEGLFYDYYFDMGKAQTCNELFCPAYSYAVSKDPISDKPEYYLAVGLNSGMKQSDFSRKKLNLVIVMDISGSMGEAFNQYYYDNPGSNPQADDKSKIQIADESVVALLNHLQTGDRFGMVLFDDRAYLAKPMGLVEDTDMEALKRHILAIREQGGTNMEAGLKTGTELLNEFKSADPAVYENRMIFLTDAQPNTGDISSNGFLGITQGNADSKIYTTFIGVGVDFNTQLIESVTKITGANYYSVHNSQEFSKRMDEGFDYMVTPLVFDLNLNLSSTDFEIARVYGSPQANEATGEIMKVATLFPSDSQNNEVKGGLVLLKLKEKAKSTGRLINLSVAYTDRQNQPHANQASINMPMYVTNYYENSGIRKGVLLSRYANLLINWIGSERQTNGQIKMTSLNRDTGILDPDITLVSQWERTSLPLKVSNGFDLLFSDFKKYFENEAQQLNDKTLDQESQVLDLLISKGQATSTIPSSFTCPSNGWQNCMPILTPVAAKACTPEAEAWYKANCPNFQGLAQ